MISTSSASGSKPSLIDPGTAEPRGAFCPAGREYLIELLRNLGACECGVDAVCALMRRAQEAERELDRVRVDLVTAQHAIGEGWFAGGADTATAIERKTKALEDGARDAEARATAAEARVRDLRQLSASDNCEIIKLRVRDREQAARIVALEGALREACDWLDSYEDAAACEYEVRTLDAFTARARSLLTPTAPTAATTPTTPAPEGAGEGERT